MLGRAPGSPPARRRSGPGARCGSSAAAGSPSTSCGCAPRSPTATGRLAVGRACGLSTGARRARSRSSSAGPIRAPRGARAARGRCAHGGRGDARGRGRRRAGGRTPTASRRSIEARLLVDRDGDARRRRRRPGRLPRRSPPGPATRPDPRRGTRPAPERRPGVRARRDLDAGRPDRPGARARPSCARRSRRRATAGINMLRIPGTGAYESEAFHDLCDELGLLVWQDFMFANLDYPIADEGFRAAGRARGERRCSSGSPAARASRCSAATARSSSRWRCSGSIRSSAAASSSASCSRPRPAPPGADAVYLPSAPCGGRASVPHRSRASPTTSASAPTCARSPTRAGPRSGSPPSASRSPTSPTSGRSRSCSASRPADAAVGGPRWKAGVPRDVGSGWDFDDVRDHYLRTLFGVDPAELRSVEPHRYLELSRAVSGEVMAEVFGEWRRAGSPCGGGIVLWLRDLVPGAGWGLFDHRGEPKVAYHHLRRALAPVAVWTTDEGLGGIAVHLANDRPEPLRARLRVGALPRLRAAARRGERDRRAAPPTASAERNVETLLGRFVDAAWAYRFGPPAQDLIVASLERDATTGPRSCSRSRSASPRDARSPPSPPPASASRPARRPRARTAARCCAATSRRLAYGVRVHAPGFAPDDDAFSIEPGTTRERDPAPARARGGHRRRRADRAQPRGQDPRDRGRGAARDERRPAGSRALPRRPRPPRPSASSTRAAGEPQDVSVLICPPFGWEDFCSYRSRLAWAQALAAGGLRRASDRPPGHRRQRRRPRRSRPASTRGRRRSPRRSPGCASRPAAARVATIGIGLGGLIACRAVAAGAAIDDLVLWAVPARGRTLLRELRAFARLNATEVDASDALDAAGDARAAAARRRLARGRRLPARRRDRDRARVARPDHAHAPGARPRGGC